MTGTGKRHPGTVPRSSTENDASQPAVQVSGVTAEYSLGCTPTGEWFALGTVRDETVRLIVGTGPTESDAIDQLKRKLSDRFSLA